MASPKSSLYSLSLAAPGRGPMRLTLVDADDGAELECALPQDPWEESADVPAEALMRFREALAQLPEGWSAAAAAPQEGPVLEVSIDDGGPTKAFVAPLGSQPLPPGKRAFLEAFVEAALATVEAGRSRRAIEMIAHAIGERG